MDASAYNMSFDKEQLALLCANYDRRIDALARENARLKAENDRLREVVSDGEESARLILHESRVLQAENAKLRKAVATAIRVQAVLCGNADSLYCCNECPLHRPELNDCLACDVIEVAQELGVEVDNG